MSEPRDFSKSHMGALFFFNFFIFFLSFSLSFFLYLFIHFPKGGILHNSTNFNFLIVKRMRIIDSRSTFHPEFNGVFRFSKLTIMLRNFHV